MSESDRHDQRVTARTLANDSVWRTHYVRCAGCAGLFDALQDDGDFDRGEWKCRACCDKESA